MMIDIFMKRGNHNMLLRVFVYVLLVALTVSRSGAAGRERISLAGPWRFALDRREVGTAEGWYREHLEGTVRLPGSLQEQGFGDDVSMHTRWTGSILDSSWFTSPAYAPYREPGNVKIPFWLQPEKHYVGVAWYQRDVDIPVEWRSRRIVLVLERPHWETTVWLDTLALGSRNSLSTPHRYVLPLQLTPGGHRLTVRVKNSMVIPVGINAHSVSDQTQGNWNGIIGDLALVATDRVWIEDVQVWPDLRQQSARVLVSIGNAAGSPARGSAVVSVLTSNAAGRTTSQEIGQSGASLECTLPLGEPATPWDEFSPTLHPLRVTLTAWRGDETFRDTLVIPAGFRSVTRQGTQIAVNGRKVFLRGTLECCIFPQTGYPPTDTASWTRIMRIAAAHGLNHLRFHSWCPPRAAFEAADRIGFYLYVECPSWANDGPTATVGDGLPVDRWLYEEGDRILREYGNHPSFIMMSYGNEPGGEHQQKYLGDLIESWKRKDSRRLYTSASGWPMIPQNDFHVTPTPRIQAWGEGLNSRINARPPETVTDYREFIASADAPVVSHEIGQWCVYPNFAEIPKYTGSLKPKNMEIFRDRLEARGMGDIARAFLMASGKLQTLCYKEEIESALRTPGMAGFELLDLHDFPGQGTALVGVLDAFWDEKGYVTPAEYSRFCAATVPLARMKKRVFIPGERFSAAIDIAHYGPRDLSRAVIQWSIRSEAGTVITSGALPAIDIPTGALTPAGSVDWSWEEVVPPAKLVLDVRLEGMPWSNSWDFWVFPAPAEASFPSSIHVAPRLDNDAFAVLQKGGKVLLLPAPSSIVGDEFGRVRIGFSSIFWNTAWTSRQAPHTMGILCDPAHPLFRTFATDPHTNWQWWELVSRSHPFILDAASQDLRPIVQVVDDWFTSRRLGLIFEAKVAGGSLLACGIDITHNLGARPVAAQLRRSMIDYMDGARFDPTVSMDPSLIAALVGKPSRMEEFGAHVMRADAGDEGSEAPRILDGDPATYWRTPSSGPGFPHEIVLGLDRVAVVGGVRVTPRQDRREGWINGYAVYVSENPGEWGAPAMTGLFTPDAGVKVVTFPAPQRCRFVRFVATSSFTSASPVAALGELELLFEDE